MTRVGSETVAPLTARSSGMPAKVWIGRSITERGMAMAAGNAATGSGARRGSSSLPGILCLEGELNEDMRKKSTVRPVLEMLETLDKAQVVHRNVAVKEDLAFYVDTLQKKRYEKFQVLYLAMHGDEGAISTGGADLTLEDLGELLAGTCKGRVIYFGTCLTMKATGKELKQFAAVTGARAVIGYRKSVPFDTVAAFELPLMQELVTSVRGGTIYSRLKAEHPVLAKKLGLVVATKNEVHMVPLRATTV